MHWILNVGMAQKQKASLTQVVMKHGNHIKHGNDLIEGRCIEFCPNLDHVSILAQNQASGFAHMSVASSSALKEERTT